MGSRDLNDWRASRAQAWVEMGTGSLGFGGGSLDLGVGSLDLEEGSLDLGAGSFDLGEGSLDLGTGFFSLIGSGGISRTSERLGGSELSFCNSLISEGEE